LRNGVGFATNNTGVFVYSNVQGSYTIRVTATNAATTASGLNMNTGVALTMLPDADSDGMADGWEVQYGFSPSNAADALLDFDGDQMINRDEYIAGTNPTNEFSLLKLMFTTTNSPLPALEFVAQSNIAYTIQYRTNLLFPGWSNLMNISAQSQVRTVQVDTITPPPTNDLFYRVVTPIVR
jgi:hypothetical protein